MHSAYTFKEVYTVKKNEGKMGKELKWYSFPLLIAYYVIFIVSLSLHHFSLFFYLPYIDRQPDVGVE